MGLLKSLKKKMLVTTIVLCVFLGIAINVEGKKCNFDTYYVTWDKLEEKQQKYAEKMKWNEKNWALISGPSVTATLNYDSLIKTGDNKEEITNKWGKWKPKKKKTIKKFLKNMGLKVEGKKCYDKYISNYDDYEWNELPKKSEKSFKKLGWNESSWNGDSEYPDYTCLYYNELTNKQKKYMKNIGYPEDKDGGNWRWDDYPSTDLERAESCIEVRCKKYPDYYAEDCRSFANTDYCDFNTTDPEDWKPYFYEVEASSGKCVAKSTCETYGIYYSCEDTFVKSWCDEDFDENCLILDQCKCELPSWYCSEDYGYEKMENWYETTVDGTCERRDWCDIFTDCYNNDISSLKIDSQYMTPLFDKC